MEAYNETKEIECGEGNKYKLLNHNFSPENVEVFYQNKVSFKMSLICILNIIEQ